MGLLYLYFFTITGHYQKFEDFASAKYRNKMGFENVVGTRDVPASPHPSQHISPYIIISYYKNTIISPSPKSLNICKKYSITLQGFEDCRLLDQLLLRHNDIAVVLKEFSAIRNTDAEGICDLSMYNYLEVILYTNQKIFLILLWLRPMGCRLLQNKFLKDFKQRMW